MSSSSQINNPDFNTQFLQKNTSKPKQHFQNSNSNKIEMEADDGSFTIKKYDSTFIRKIQEFRRDNELNQQQFAQKLQLPLQIVKGIESNTLSYNHNYIQKINNYIDKNKKIKL